LTRLYDLKVTDAVPETIEATLQLSEAALIDIGIPMGLVIASIHEKRDEFRHMLQAPERQRHAVRTPHPCQRYAIKRRSLKQIQRSPRPASSLTVTLPGEDILVFRMLSIVGLRLALHRPRVDANGHAQKMLAGSREYREHHPQQLTMRLFPSGKSKCLRRARACLLSSASCCLSCTGPSGASGFRSLRGSLSLERNEAQKLFRRARPKRPRPPVTSRQLAKQISFAGQLLDRGPSALFASRLTKLNDLEKDLRWLLDQSRRRAA
jgi:hypothetical protein